MDTDIIPPSKQQKNQNPLPTQPLVSPEPIAPSFAPEPKKKSNVLALLFAFIAVLGMFLQPKSTDTAANNCEQTSSSKTPSSNQSTLNSDEFYFYLGELGLKVAVPEEYKNKISYLYDESGTVYVWGHTATERPAYSDALSASSVPFLAISSSIDEFTSNGYSFFSGEKIITAASGVTYYYHGPNLDSSALDPTLEEDISNLKSFFVDTYKYSNL